MHLASIHEAFGLLTPRPNTVKHPTSTQMHRCEQATLDEFKAFFQDNATQFGEEATGDLLAWFEDLAAKFTKANPNAASDAIASDADDAARAEIKAKRLAAKEEVAAAAALAAEGAAAAVAAAGAVAGEAAAGDEGAPVRAALLCATPAQIKACLLAIKACVAAGPGGSEVASAGDLGTWDEATEVRVVWPHCTRQQQPAAAAAAVP